MDALFPMSSYSFMVPLLYTSALFTITFKLLKNNIITKIKIRYVIKNRFFLWDYYVIGCIIKMGEK